MNSKFSIAVIVLLTCPPWARAQEMAPERTISVEVNPLAQNQQ